MPTDNRITIIPLTGEAIRPVIDDLARLRIAVFREWPYLYDGDMGYEQHYLQKYANTEGALVVLAKDGNDVVGASTAIPLDCAEKELSAPFITHGFSPKDWYYFGESILLPAYRGKGIGIAFFEAREKQAETLGYTKTCFCSVQRPADHPLRPTHYKPLDSLWGKRGFQKQEDLVTHFHWLDVGETTETSKPLIFWTRGAA